MEEANLGRGKMRSKRGMEVVKAVAAGTGRSGWERGVWKVRADRIQIWRQRQGNFKMPCRFGQLGGGWGTCGDEGTAGWLPTIT